MIRIWGSGCHFDDDLSLDNYEQYFAISVQPVVVLGWKSPYRYP